MSSVNNFLEDLTIGKAVVFVLGGMVMGLVWLLNVVFTFSYGYDVVGPFLLLDQLGANGSAMLSGTVAVLFFDISYTVGFVTFLFGCHSTWQYAVTVLQGVTTFILSIGASVVAIVLLSPLGDYVPPVAIEATRYLGYAALIIGFVVNAVATIGYIVASPAMAEQIRQTVKAVSELQSAIRRQNKLDRQSRTQADEKIDAFIPFMAQIKAEQSMIAYLKSQGHENPEAVMRQIKRMQGVRAINDLKNEPETGIMAADGGQSPELHRPN